MEAGQPLCACMAGAKHAEQSSNGGVVQPGMFHVLEDEAGKALQDILTLLIAIASNTSMDGMTICHRLLFNLKFCIPAYQGRQLSQFQP